MKILRMIPGRLLLYLFRAKEVRSERERLIFHRLWTLVWVQQGYAHEGEPLPVIEAHYATFDPFSTDLILYFLVFPIGTLRLIWEDERAGLPALNDFKVTRDWKGEVVEATLFTVRKEWQFGGLAALLLMREGYRRIVSRGVGGLVGAFDQRFFRLMKMRGAPLRQVGEAKFYEGSETIPAYLSFAEAKRVLPPHLVNFFLS